MRREVDERDPVSTWLQLGSWYGAEEVGRNSGSGPGDANAAGYGNPAYGEGGGKWAGTPVPAMPGAGAQVFRGAEHVSWAALVARSRQPVDDSGRRERMTIGSIQKHAASLS